MFLFPPFSTWFFFPSCCSIFPFFSSLVFSSSWFLVNLFLYEFWREMFLLSRDILGIFESDQLGNAKETLVREEEVVVLEDLDIAEKVLFIETKESSAGC